MSKTPYGERHLICDLLYQNGARRKAIFYGGRGGGKSAKPSQLELGHQLTHPADFRKKGDGLVSLREWDISWDHSHIANNHKAYFYLSFYCELIRKISVDSDDETGDKLYNLLSNAIYFLEEDIKKNCFIPEVHLGLFLVKITYYSGVFPGLEYCYYCGKKLTHQNVKSFFAQEGAFGCNCDSSMSSIKTGQEALLYSLYQIYSSIRYKARAEAPVIASNVLQRAFSYFLSQFQLEQNTLKSSKFIF